MARRARVNQVAEGRGGFYHRRERCRTVHLPTSVSMRELRLLEGRDTCLANKFSRSFRHLPSPCEAPTPQFARVVRLWRLDRPCLTLLHERSL